MGGEFKTLKQEPYDEHKVIRIHNENLKGTYYDEQ